MQLVLKIIAGAASVYMLLLIIRILLTWFQGPRDFSSFRILDNITEPYLSLFRRITFLRTDRIDFSPLAALLVLGIFINIINTLATYGIITLGVILAIIISALWSSLSWILTFFIILTLIRLVALLFEANSVSPFMQTLDIIIRPLLAWTSRVILRGKTISFRMILVFTSLFLLITAFAGRLLIRLLIKFLLSLPF